jgi:hypothetical protein
MDAAGERLAELEAENKSLLATVELLRARLEGAAAEFRRLERRERMWHREIGLKRCSELRAELLEDAGALGKLEEAAPAAPVAS